ncbi:hypothetical protein BDL97_13G090400 [Sphagnum fallax]|nr:hypothetical protein BDL97_13G090400 [Sphagnum fallax]
MPMLCLELLLTISTSRTLYMIPRMCDFMSLWALPILCLELTNNPHFKDFIGYLE